MAALNIPDEQLNTLVVNAILSAIDGPEKEKILASAVTELLSKKSEYGRSAQSRLQEAFGHAVERIAREEAFKIISSDEGFREKIRDLVREGVEKALTDRDKVTNRIAYAVMGAFSGER
jgi:hypothetical protein